jgi:uncharacterized repeat protein (TIGR02543 family)
MPLTVTGDDSYTATYTQNEYTVTFYEGLHGSTTDTTTFTGLHYGDTFPTPPSITAELGWTFDGWPTMPLTVTGDDSYTATYTIIQHTVTFVDYNGTTVLGTDVVDYGTGATAPANPTRSGYTFTGWDTDFSNVTSDLTVTALYSANPSAAFRVLFQDFDGTLLSVQWVHYGFGATAPASPARDGFTFTGWDNAYNHITGPLTVTALYTPVAAPPAPTPTPAPTVIPELTAPQAAPSAAPTPAPEVIEEEETPQATPGIAWALLNLILAVATAIMAIVLIVGYFTRRKKEEEDGQRYNIKRKGVARIISLIPGIGGIIVFLLTEPWWVPYVVFTDVWTWLMIVIFAAQIVVAIFARKKKEEKDDGSAPAEA